MCRYAVFQSCSTLAKQLAAALSPLVLIALSRAFDLDLSIDDAYSDVASTSFIALALPFTAVQFVVQLAAVQSLLDEGIIKWFPT